MSSTGPSPLFFPLHPSPRLVAEMTGLSLPQSELEVTQQAKLKRMIRRIRASRSARLSGSPRSAQVLNSTNAHKKATVTTTPVPVPAFKLPGPMVVATSGDGSHEEKEKEVVENEDEWRDDEVGAFERLDITMDISDEPGAQELEKRVATLFNEIFAPVPPITGAQVAVHRLSGAMTNCVYMATITPAPTVPMSRAPRMLRSTNARVRQTTAQHHQQLQQLPRKYLLRVYGAGVDEFLSREKELYWLDQLTALGFGPQMYGIFGNGRLEEFLESTTLTKDDICHPSTSKHIARRMCELHSLVSYYRPIGGKGQHQDQAELRVDRSGRPELWTNVDAWMRLVQRKWPAIRRACGGGNAQCAEILDNWPRVEQAVRRFRAHIEETTQSPVVFAHGDLQYGNILRLESTGELVVVDFEYAGYNYRGFDIANHFCEWMADYHHATHPHLLDPARYPTDVQRRAFLRTYVRAKAFVDANVGADVRSPELCSASVSDASIRAEVEKLDREVARFVPASHLHWGMWGLLQACSSEIDFDYAAYAAQRLSMFLAQAADLQ
ncbi:hypothetical protein IWW48_003522 [Coemansia sp. RSA 1200]|nr:hypothetical protein IWW48_003522 [Coemansia sp. RSA 1200]